MWRGRRLCEIHQGVTKCLDNGPGAGGGNSNPAGQLSRPTNANVGWRDVMCPRAHARAAVECFSTLSQHSEPALPVKVR